jgi:hypothetical protein
MVSNQLDQKREASRGIGHHLLRIRDIRKQGRFSTPTCADENRRSVRVARSIIQAVKDFLHQFITPGHEGGNTSKTGRERVLAYSHSNSISSGHNKPREPDVQAASQGILKKILLQ